MKSSLNRQTIRLYLQILRSYRWVAFAIILFSILARIANMLVPTIYKQLIDYISLSPDKSTDAAIRFLFIIVGYNLVGWIFWRTSELFDNYFNAKALQVLSNTSFKTLHAHSVGFFHNSFSGSLVRQVGRFTSAFDVIFNQIVWNITSVVVTVSVAVCILAKRFPGLAIFILIWAIVYTAFNWYFAKVVQKYDLERAAADSDVTGQLADSITNHANLKLFNGQGKENSKYQTLTQKLFKLQLRTYNMDTALEGVRAILVTILEFTIFYIAIQYWKVGRLTVGDFIMIQAYFLEIIIQLWGLSRYISRIIEALTDAKEMTEIYMQAPEIQDSEAAKTLEVSQGGIEFSDLTFAHSVDKPVFENFNLKIKPGERLAIIGPSGGGKSTLIRLLMRFSDPQSGEILIDSQNIREVTQESLRHQLSLVPQEPLLFHRTILENIGYAKPEATKEEIVKAAQAARCHEFIKALPEGYDTMVGERGVKLSGGERQRVAIARAILKNSPILVLDEATSSLDSVSEQLIQEALTELMRDKTVIVIAHRLSTIMQMDRIVVLKDGKVVEEGTHQELLEIQDGAYQNLWQIQAGGFESKSLQDV